jgi:hypothetical protein
VPLADQGVDFPVAQTFTSLDNLWTLFNTDPIWQFSTPVILAITLAMFSMLSQMGLQITLCSLISQNVLIDPLMANLYLLPFFPASPKLVQDSTLGAISLPPLSKLLPKYFSCAQLSLVFRRLFHPPALGDSPVLLYSGSVLYQLWIYALQARWLFPCDYVLFS